MKKNAFEIRQLDCYMYEDDWTVNTSYLLGTMYTSAQNEKAAFVRFLNALGIRFIKNRTRIEFDGDNYTIIDRKTKEPLFIAIYNN